MRIQRGYELPSPDDGARILVGRLWLRGLTKEAAPLDAWGKDNAPATEVRKWFGHDPTRWAEFRRRYEAELLGASTDACTWRRLAQSLDGHAERRRSISAAVVAETLRCRSA